MRSAESFKERLDELLFEHSMTTDGLGKELGISGGVIRCWRTGKHAPLLSNAVMLADFFNCSLEFITGRSDTKLDFTPRATPPFYDRLRNIMKERGTTVYRLTKKEKVISDAKLYSWKKGGDPFLQSVIDLADYFGLTTDALIGRE